MNKLTIWLLGLLLVAGSSGLFAQVSTRTPTPATTASVSTTVGETRTINLLQPLQQMITKIKALQPTGDPDFDFAFVAKVHTQGTQDLLSAILQAGPDSALTQAVKTMLSTARTDGVTVTSLMKELKPTRPNATFTKQQNRTIAAISEKLKQSASTYKLTSNLAKNGAILVNDQRQDAVNLATTYLQFGRNTDLRNFAQQSIEKAKSDLDLIKNLSKTNR